MIEINKTAQVSPLADIEDSKHGSKIIINSNVIIDSFVKIKPAGGCGDVVIGEHTVINSGCVIYTGNGLKIGKGVAIASNCTFSPVNHEYKKKNTPIREQGFQKSKGGIFIEDDVWIGAGCIILDGSILRKGCVIGAMSLVRGEVASYSIQAGSPLKQLGWRK